MMWESSMKNKFVPLMLIVVLCFSTNSALAYNNDTVNLKQIAASIATNTMQSSPAYKVGFAIQVKMNLMLLLAPNFRIICSRFVKKGTTLDFCQIRPTQNQSFSNTDFLAAKQR
jgi:hypothetical protein